MDLDSMQKIVEQARALRKPIWQVVLEYDVETGREEEPCLPES